MKISVFFAVIFCILMTAGCSEKEKKIKPEENTLDFTVDSAEEIEIQESGSGGMANGNLDDDEPEKKEYAYKINNANIYDINSPIEIDDIVFKYKNTEFSKELKADISCDDILYFDDEIDEKGRLKDGFTYIYTELVIRNETGKEQEVYLSAGNFVVINKENDVIDMSEELRYRSGYENPEKKKDYYRSSFSEGEEKEVLLVYIVPDNLLEQDNLLYSINLYGEGSSDELKAFKIR